MRSPILLTMLTAAAIMTAGCATIAEPRVRAALIDAGLSEADARCMAGRMVDRLSIGQLRGLERLAREGRDAAGRRSLRDFVGAVSSRGDADTIAVVASSAALCATGFAR